MHDMESSILHGKSFGGTESDTRETDCEDRCVKTGLGTEEVFRNGTL